MRRARKVLAEGGKVLVRRTCPEHGDFDGLVCSDVAWWEDLPRFTVEGILSTMTYTGRRGAGFAGDPLTRLTIPAAQDQMERTSSGVLHRRDFMPLTMPNPMCAAIGYFLISDQQVDPLIPLGDLDRIIEYTKNGSFGGVTDEFEQFLKEAIDRVYAAPAGDGEALLGRFRALLEALFPPHGAPLEAEARRKTAEERIKSVYLMQFMDPWTFDARRLTRCSCQHVLPDGKIVASCGYYAYHRRFDPRFNPRFDTSLQPS